MKNSIDRKHPQYLSFLGMLVSCLWITCLITQSRLVVIPKGYIAAAVIPYPFFCCVLDIIAEVYGYMSARRILLQSLLLLYTFAITIFLFDKLPAPEFWYTYTRAFDITISPIIREVIVGSVAVLVGQYINIYIFSRMLLFTKGKFFAARSAVSTILGDSITFSLALYGDFGGHIPFHKIMILIVDELVFMYLLAIILTAPATIIVSILRKIEPEFNMSVTFNPFIKPRENND